ncbi:phage holin family protein [Denitrificimonas sp. JX-1]|uniref:Phage holin family protein n=1 Tax=Denitrificimonas halotolerans TaxID=3098930 RepID=A0ABU5GQB1_9GAMM|nr:phage holin family protein [Denitrificimonas sp. JX-1]MDY7219185.1 phage holin family protein [Denitrificimonas sp. JX-1]
MAEQDFSNTSRRLGAATLDLISDHAELFVLELQEQKRHSSQQLLWLGITAACAFMLFLLLNALLIVLLWDRYDYLLLIAMSIFYACSGLFCIWRLKSAHNHAQPPFSASLQELKKTKEQLLP